MSEIHEIEQQTQQYIDYAFANEKIGQLRDICDEIELCYKEIMEVEDDYSEGKVYAVYMQTVESITGIMKETYKSIMGYIDILEFAVQNFETIDLDMTNYLGIGN